MKKIISLSTINNQIKKIFKSSSKKEKKEMLIEGCLTCPMSNSPIKTAYLYTKKFGKDIDSGWSMDESSIAIKWGETYLKNNFLKNKSLNFIISNIDEIVNDLEENKDISFLENNLICPISRCLLDDPVMSFLSQESYSRFFYSKWIKENHTDPSTRNLSTEKFLTIYPNRNLDKFIRILKFFYDRE